MSSLSKLDGLYIIYIAIALFYTLVIAWDIILFLKNRNLLNRHSKRVRRYQESGFRVLQLQLSAMVEADRLVIEMNINKLESGLRKILHDDPSEDVLLFFLSSFNDAYPSFISSINSIIPGLTSHEVRLSILIRLNVTSKEISRILNVTSESVNKARYRLRKKIGLPRQHDLYQFLISI